MSNNATNSNPGLVDSRSLQRSAAVLGMWIFLTTELLFFGALFVAYTVYRFEYSAAFVSGSDRLNLWSGGAMTALLILGSWLVALADRRTQQARGKAWQLLLPTAALGIAFLGLEFHEYYNLINEGLFPSPEFDGGQFANAPLTGRSVGMFFTLFFCMTGLHALHMLIGVTLVTGIAVLLWRSHYPSQHANSLTVIALYWHFVDIVWVFLYPLFYLVK